MKEIYSDIPLWSLFFWAIIVIALSIFYYQRKSWVKDIQQWKRLLLISLRSLGLFLLGVLLMGILLKGTNSEINQPLLITIVDDSKSMKNYADSATVETNSKEFLNTLSSQMSTKFDVLNYNLSDRIYNIDSLRFINNETNLGNALNSAYENYYGRNIGAIIVLSDGNFNVGNSPLSVMRKLKNIPIYSLGIGDTIQKVDHLVKTITANDIAFMGNKFPVEVTLEGNKTPNVSFEVQLLEEGKIIDSKNLQHINDDYSNVKVDFLLDASKLGIHQYTVKITDLKNEYNVDNNSKSFFVEVLDDRSKILLVGENLNPDLGAIQGALANENNLELTTVMANDLPESLNTFDLIIWHNPGGSGRSEVVSKIMDAKKPIWYFITPQTSMAILSKLQLMAEVRFSGQTDEVAAAFNQGFNLFTVSSETRKALDNFSPLKAPFGKVKFGNNASILTFQRLGKVVKTEPLMYFSEQQSTKFAVTLGTGIWQWRINDYRVNGNHKAFNEIISKTIQYLVIKENTSRLRVNIPTMTSNETDFIINASFYNESYEPITETTIRLELNMPNGKTMHYSFLALDKEYTLNLGKLPTGRYSWEASTSFNGEKFSKGGEFAVKDIDLEGQDTKANHQLLKQLATNSDAYFALLEDYSEIIQLLKERDDIVPVAYETSTYNKLIDHLWWLILIVALFSTEWFIRRYSGGY